MTSRATETLVHIAAPSRASDDKRYRALAEAYLGFEPESRIDLSIPAGDAPEPEPEPGPGQQPPVFSLQPPLAGSFRQPLQSPQLSFESVWDNAASPRLPAGEPPSPDGDDASQPSWVAPPSVIADSNPENHVSVAAYCSPTRVLEHYLQQAVDSSQDFSAHDGPSGGGSRGAVPPSSHPAHDATACTEPVSSLAEIVRTPVGSLRRPRQRDASSGATQDLERIASSQLSGVVEATEVIIPATARADSEPPPPKRPKRTPAQEFGVQPLARSASDVLPRGAHPAEAGPPSSRPPSSSKRSVLAALEIRPPDPPVAADDLTPGDLVTRKLAKLAEDLEMAKRFRPKLQVRELRPFERGYWLLDCAGWDRALREDAWVFLTNYVGNGNGGWGVWCQRDEGFTWIRTYCWGFVVGHVYLLLHLASKRKLKQCEVSWYGAGGDALVVVGPRTG